MTQRSKRYLTGGTLAVLAILFVALTVVVGIIFRGARLDLTENELYSVSDGTEHLLEQIGEPINLYLYFSRDTVQQVPGLTPYLLYATRVREMLEEFADQAGGKINLEVIDPLPFSEAEDEASAYGLAAVPVGPAGERMFFGLVGTNAVDDVETLPFLDPAKEEFLEYDLARLVYRLDHPELPVVGLMTGLPMTRGFDPATRQMREPWVIVTQMEQMFEVRNVAPTATEIEDDVDLLMVVHPKNLAAATQYAIDQFVMRGGKLVAFVDPHADVEQPPDQMDPQAAMFADRSSNLQQLFEGWGVGYDPQQVVLDAANGLQVSGGPGRPPVRHIGVLNLGESAMNEDDVTLANLDSIFVALAGHVAAAPDAGFSVTPLLTSSAASATVAAERIRFLPDPSMLLNDFAPTDQQYVLAARIEGPLQSAFPDGAPATGDAESPSDGESDALGSTEDASIIVVADVDLLADRMWVRVQQFFGQQMLSTFANNGDFVLNVLDNYSGSSDLISIRGRATSQRPFTRVQELQREAEDRFRATEQQLEQELQETERKLNELQTGRDDANPMILTPEQQAEIERFQQERLRIRKELRAVQANLRSDIENLGTWLKVINIVLVPALLTLLVLALLAVRAKRRKEG